MMISYKKTGLLLIGTLLIGFSAISQDLTSENSRAAKLKINLGADVMSRYVWRGSDFGKSPSIQPTLSISKENLEIGCWSAVATNNSYKEIDLYAKYTLKNFSLVMTDYFIPEMNGIAASPDNRYFIYNNKNTAHTLEASLLFKGNENFPVWLLAGVFIYGNDKRWGYNAEYDSIGKTYYSSYIEAGYTFTIKENKADLFLGFTPKAGAYGQDLGFVNVGVTGYRTVKISDDFELTVKGSLIFNPQSSQGFFVFGITI
jgi:hypothetical protein